MQSEFRLYPEERHWWSFDDYRHVLEVTRSVKPERVLEFGPGSSTLALVEGGAGSIDCCEDDPKWSAVYRQRLEGRFGGQVKIVDYVWSDPVDIAGICPRYDLALIDGPLGTPRRGAVLEFCLDRCDAVLICVEDAKGPGLLKTILSTAERRNRAVEITKTGPFAGSFALFNCA